MLATSGQLPPDDGRWAYEPKWDGFRAIVHVKGRVVVWSRRGTDLTDRFPEVAELASAERWSDRSASVSPDTSLCTNELRPGARRWQHTYASDPARKSRSPPS